MPRPYTLPPEPADQSSLGDIDLRFITNDELYQSEIAAREAHLLELGFDSEFIEVLKDSRPTLQMIDSIDSKIAWLLDRGFANPVKLIDSRPQILGYSFAYINEKLTGLTARGFKKPVKLITSRPTLLGLSFVTIDKKLTQLRKRGFRDPVKLISDNPAILGLSFENIDEKLAQFSDKGFSDPVKLVADHPTILGLGSVNIDKKLIGLRERGFTDPVRLVASHPPILGLGFENIDEKITQLRKTEGTDPIKLITSHPPLLGLSFENINRKLKLIVRVEHLMGIDIPPAQILAENTPILSAKIDKLIIICRIAMNYEIGNLQNNSALAMLTFANLENLVLAHLQIMQSDMDRTISQLVKTANIIKAEGWSKEQKRAMIAEADASDKVVQAYFRGYKEG